MSKEEKGYPLLRGALAPAAAVGGGMFLGSVMGSTAARAVLRTPGMKQYLQRANPAQRRQLVDRITMATKGIGAVSGGAISGISYKILQDELKKRSPGSSEKTAMFLFCLKELRELQ
jgi:hypothetical protein